MRAFLSVTIFYALDRGADVESHELSVAPGAQKTVLFITPLLPDTALHLRLVVPETGQQASVSRVSDAGQAPGTTLSLTAETPELDVVAPDLGAAGQLLLVRNTGAVPVRVAASVVAG